VTPEGMALTDLVFGAVKASSRKGKLFTNQQVVDLVGSRDLKDLQNRIKERYPSLAASAPSLKGIEEGLARSYKDEVDEFIKATPELEPALRMAQREVGESEAIEALKTRLGIVTPDSKPGERRLAKDEASAQSALKGFDKEVQAATAIYEKYKVPGLINAAFARQRILNLTDPDFGMPKEALDELGEYSRLKTDVFNSDIILRGIKNGIDRRALMELTIHGGGIQRKLLMEAAKQTEIKKAMALLETAGLPKVDSPRALERYYESKVSKMMSRAYYDGYLGAGSIMGYLELKYREIRNIMRIANAISLGIDPKRTLQDFIF
jgi:vacuolar-type H+-ATPase subunit C/Vma6